MASDAKNVAKGMVVSFDYVLTLVDGEEIDRTAKNAPVAYLHGAQNITPSLERAMTGLEVGGQKRIMLRAADGYGEYDPKNKQVLPRNAFPNGFKLEEGVTLEVEDEATGEDVPAVIDKVLPNQVVLDLNHPLAGENLFFAVKVVEIRPATQEEIADGHAN